MPGTTTARKIHRRILRIKAVRERTGLSSPTIYRLMQAGEFPRQVPIGALAVGWLEDEVDDWLDARIAERDHPGPRGMKRRSAGEPLAPQEDVRRLGAMVGKKAAARSSVTVPDPTAEVGYREVAARGAIDEHREETD